MFRSSNQKSHLNRYYKKRLDKVIYSLLASLIILGIILLTLNRESNDKAVAADLKATRTITVDNEDTGLVEGDESKTNDKAKAVLLAQEAAEQEREDKDAANRHRSDFATPWFLIFVLAFSTAANGCIAVFIFRYYRESIKLQSDRIKLLSDKKFVEREDFQEALENFVTSVSKIGQELGKIKEFNQNAVTQIVTQTNRVLTEIDIQSKGHGEGIEKLMDTFLSLHVKLNEKDAEITRYKEGYDTKKIKSSLTGYIKVRDRIQSYADNEKTSLNDLDKLLIIIESAIDNLGASEIEVTIGDNFYDDKYVGLTDDPEIIETDDPEKDGLIAAIVKKGYEIKGQETNTTIRSAKLKIYKHEPKEN
jgi:hypothetical protein